MRKLLPSAVLIFVFAAFHLPQSAQLAARQDKGDIRKALSVAKKIDDKLRIKKKDLAPIASDGEFIRRLYLDLIGRPPTLKETRRFLKDDAEDKRTELIETLLNKQDYADLWSRRWMEVLFGNYYGVQARFGGKRVVGRTIRKGMGSFRTWFREQFMEDVPWPKTVLDLLLSMGKLTENPATMYKAQFFYNGSAYLNFADEMSKSLLGMQISCARCHDHPFDKWSQEDYYGLAAFIVRVRAMPIGGAKNDECDDAEFFEADKGDLTMPGTAKVMRPKFLFGGAAGTTGPRLEYLAQFMVTKGNTQFYTNAVNRAWGWLMGRGFVHPLDDFNMKNKPKAGSVMKLLTEEFRRNGSHRHLIRSICNSKAYQRSSANGGGSTFSSAGIRTLTVEQMYRSIVIALAATDKAPDWYDKAYQKHWGNFRNEIRAVFPAGVEWTEVTRLPGNTQVALLLRNSKFVDGLVKYRSGLSGVVQGMDDDPESRIRTIFNSVLCRDPFEKEMNGYKTYLAEQNASMTAYEDIIWTLVNSGEFSLRH